MGDSYLLFAAVLIHLEDLQASRAWQTLAAFATGFQHDEGAGRRALQVEIKESAATQSVSQQQHGREQW